MNCFFLKKVFGSCKKACTLVPEVKLFQTCLLSGSLCLSRVGDGSPGHPDSV